MIRSPIAAAAVLALAALATPVLAQPTMKSGSESLAPPGEGPGAMTPPSRTNGTSNKSRASVKATTKAAQASGTLTPPGPAPVPETLAARPGANQAQTLPDTKSRAGVKADTKAAARDGSLVPPGEAPRPVVQPQPK